MRRCEGRITSPSNPPTIAYVQVRGGGGGEVKGSHNATPEQAELRLEQFYQLLVQMAFCW